MDFLRFLYEALIDFLEDTKEKFMSVACRPTFVSSFFGIIGLIIHFFCILVITAIILFFSLLIIALVLSATVEFPIVTSIIVGTLGFIALLTFIVRKFNPKRIALSKRLEQEKIDKFVVGFRNKFYNSKTDNNGVNI